MSDIYIGEIFMFGANFAPRGSAFCMGQLLPVASETTLYSLIRNIYGGDGRTSFALPQLGGRTPIGSGSGAGLQTYNLADSGGHERVTLTEANLPSHSHSVSVSVGAGAPNTNDPTNHYLSNQQSNNFFSSTGDGALFTWSETGSVGENVGHNNVQPYQTVNYCIQLQGIYPSRN